MKLLAKAVCIPILIATFSCAAHGDDENNVASVKSIASARHCKPVNASVLAYLHVSRHGSWISDDPGTNGNGISISLTESEFPQRKRFLNYIYRPQENMNNTFRARFTGATSCNENGVPVLNVHTVDQILVAPVRDAG